MNLIQILDNKMRIGDLVKHELTRQKGEISSIAAGHIVTLKDYDGESIALEYKKALRKRKFAMIKRWLSTIPDKFNSNQIIRLFFTNGNKIENNVASKL